MFYVSKTLGAVFADDGKTFKLVGLAIDADGVVTISLGSDDLVANKADYAPYYSMDTDEVIAKFAVTPTTPMLPKSLVLDVPESITVYADQTTTGAKATTVIDIEALTGGTFGGTVASSNTNVFTVAYNAGTITYTPVGVGTATLTLTIEDSQNHYADAVFAVNVVVAKRELSFVQVDDRSAAAGSAKVDIELDTVAFDKVLATVDVYSTDNEVVAVTYADDGTNAVVGTISCTPHATQKGEVEVIVKGTDATATNAEAIMTFKFRVS